MTKTPKHENKKDFLLDKGMPVLWSKGYNGTSVNDIVKAAEVPKGSFYFYFKSKEDFAIQAIYKYFEYHFAPIRKILQNTLVSPKERLIQFHQYRLDTITNKMDCKMGCMACNIGNEMSEHNENIRKAICERESMLVDLITEVIQEAKDNGEITNPLDAKIIASFIEDAGKGAMTSMKETQSPLPIENMMYMIKEVILK